MEQTWKNGVYKYILLKSAWYLVVDVVVSNIPWLLPKNKISSRSPYLNIAIFISKHLDSFFSDQFRIDYLLSNTHSKTELDQLESYKRKITILKRKRKWTFTIFLDTLRLSTILQNCITDWYLWKQYFLYRINFGIRGKKLSFISNMFSPVCLSWLFLKAFF